MINWIIHLSLPINYKKISALLKQVQYKWQKINMTFQDLNLNTPLYNALDDLGLTTPTPIQEIGRAHV